MNHLKRIAGAGFALLTMLCAVILIVTMLFGATGCDNGTTKQCNCPAPKAHNGPCSCGGVGCMCRQLPIMDSVHLGEKEIVVEDQTGWFISDVKAAVETWLSEYNTDSVGMVPAIRSDIKGRSSLKMVIKQISTDWNIVSPTEFEIDVDILNTNIAVTISSAFFDMYDNYPETASLNKFDSNIRLANGLDMNVKAGWVAYQRGFSRMVWKQIKNSRVYDV